MAFLLKISKKYYPILKKPLGKLYYGLFYKKKHNIIKSIKDNVIITVGDVTTFNLLSINIFPNICIIDGITKRKRYNFSIFSKLKNKYIIYYIHNKPGSLSLYLFSLLKNILTEDITNKYYCIFIDGEEDLSILPIIILSKLNYKICYGQPKKGIVIINTTVKLKKKVLSIIYNSMKNNYL